MQIFCNMHCHKKQTPSHTQSHTTFGTQQIWQKIVAEEEEEQTESSFGTRLRELVNLNSLRCCVEINACIIYKLTRAGLDNKCVCVWVCVCLCMGMCVYLSVSVCVVNKKP